MAEIFKIATLNINGMTAEGRMGMLNEFMHKQEIDIILLQEVTHTDFESIRGYKTHFNIGINKRGTAVNKRTNFTNEHNAITIRSRDGSMLPRNLASK